MEGVNHLSRRDFLKASALAGGAVVAACSPKASDLPPTQKVIKEESKKPTRTVIPPVQPTNTPAGKGAEATASPRVNPTATAAAELPKGADKTAGYRKIEKVDYDTNLRTFSKDKLPPGTSEVGSSELPVRMTENRVGRYNAEIPPTGEKMVIKEYKTPGDKRIWGVIFSVRQIIEEAARFQQVVIVFERNKGYDSKKNSSTIDFGRLEIPISDLVYMAACQRIAGGPAGQIEVFFNDGAVDNRLFTDPKMLDPLYRNMDNISDGQRGGNLTSAVSVIAQTPENNFPFTAKLDPGGNFLVRELAFDTIKERVMTAEIK